MFKRACNNFSSVPYISLSKWLYRKFFDRPNYVRYQFTGKITHHFPPLNAQSILECLPHHEGLQTHELELGRDLTTENNIILVICHTLYSTVSVYCALILTIMETSSVLSSLERIQLKSFFWSKVMPLFKNEQITILIVHWWTIDIRSFKKRA